METFKQFLKDNDACEPAYKVAASKGFDFDRIWSEHDQGADMLWLLVKGIGLPGWPEHKQIVSLVCDCAERMLQFVPEDDNRPAEAIRITPLGS